MGDVRRVKRSAGILLYRRGRGGLEVLLVHPGGPLWAKKDAGAWSVPKGEHADDEDPIAAARRELAEETGLTVEGALLPLGEVRQAGGKRVAAWAAEGDCDPSRLVSNTFQMIWPPRSGRTIEVPEVDRMAWFDLAEAGARINAGQRPLLDRLAAALGCGATGPPRP